MFSSVQDLFYKTKDHRSNDDLGSDNLGSDHPSDFVSEVSYPESDQASDKSDSTIDIINQFEFEKKLPYLDQVKTFDRKKLKKFVKVFNYIGINIKNDDELIFRSDYLYASVGGYFLGSVYMPLLLIFNLCIFLYINYDRYKDRIICDNKQLYKDLAKQQNRFKQDRFNEVKQDLNMHRIIRPNKPNK